MLVLLRKKDQSLLLHLDQDADPGITIGELFADGPIEIRVADVDWRHRTVRLGIDAPRAIHVARWEAPRSRLGGFRPSFRQTRELEQGHPDVDRDGQGED